MPIDPQPYRDIGGSILPDPFRANHLLARLPQSEYERLRPYLAEVALEAGVPVCDEGGLLDHLYFPTDATFALVAPGGVSALHVGLIGCEGALGGPLIGDRSPLPIQVQLGGAALALPLRALRTTLAPALHEQLARHLHVMVAHLAQISACTRVHELEQRLARWLLATHDRVQGDAFSLRQKTLAEALGVQRTGVSLAAAGLRRQTLIRYSRGAIQVQDRAGLERLACPCYAWSRRVYAAALGEPEAGQWS